MNLRHLKIFVTVCKTMNTTSAADSLYISQPAVSLAIKELEQYFGVKLFDRRAHKLFITPAGTRLLLYASQILADFEMLDVSMKNWESTGQIRLGASITIGTQLMPKLILLLKRDYPDVQVFVHVNNSGIIVQQLTDNELDLALIEGNVHSNWLTFSDFMNDEVGVFCTQDNPLSKIDTPTLKDVLSQPLLLREPNSATRDMFEALLQLKGLTVTPLWECASAEVLINAALSGLGVTILPVRMVESLTHDHKLIRLHIEELSFKRTFKIAYHKNKLFSSALLRFKELCFELGQKT